jgi:glucosamine kinase
LSTRLTFAARRLAAPVGTSLDTRREKAALADRWSATIGRVSIANSSNPFVIAVDAGGSYTRVACFGLDGSLLSASKGRGGSPTHNHDAAQNIQSALTDALESGGLDPRCAVGMAAGMAGVSRRGSNQGSGSNKEWAEQYYTLPSLSCPRSVVNDAVIAHRGALVGQPGVMVVAGTGSMILAITDEGREIESGQFEHYAGGARHLVFDLMHQIFMGAYCDQDAALVSNVLAYWNAHDIGDLRQRILLAGSTDRNDIKRRYGDLAPTVTAAADTAPLADAALRALAEKTAQGVLILAPLIEREPVSVAMTGGLASDPAFSSRLDNALSPDIGAPTQIVTPVLDPLGGAAILAYELAGVPIDKPLISQLDFHYCDRRNRVEGSSKPSGTPTQ